ncbi:hypothetical protein ACX0G7_25985 [Flavitalea antarctica]
MVLAKADSQFHVEENTNSCPLSPKLPRYRQGNCCELNNLMITVQKIAPSIAQHFVDTDDSKIDEGNASITLDESKLGLYSKYLNRLHDSNVLQAETKNGNFSLTLNDFVSHVFADALVERKNIAVAHEDLVFPVCLEFKDAEVTFNLVNNSGAVRQIDQVQFDEYIDEQILQVTDSFIEIALVVWKNGGNNQHGKYLLIFIKTSSINVVESQDAAWQSLFGPEFQRYYQYFKIQLKADRYCADQTICGQLVDEVDAGT